MRAFDTGMVNLADGPSRRRCCCCCYCCCNLQHRICGYVSLIVLASDTGPQRRPCFHAAAGFLLYGFAGCSRPCAHTAVNRAAAVETVVDTVFLNHTSASTQCLLPFSAALNLRPLLATPRVTNTLLSNTAAVIAPAAASVKAAPLYHTKTPAPPLLSFPAAAGFLSWASAASCSPGCMIRILYFCWNSAKAFC